MNIGKMDKRIEIQANSATEQDAHGRPVDSWVTVFQCWACISPMSERESMVQDQVNGSRTHKISMRKCYDVSVRNRIRYGERFFDINGVVNVDEYDKRLELTCTEAT